MKVSKDFRVRRIVFCAEYMKSYCCPPREEVGTLSEAWIDRGDLVAAHYCVNYAVDLPLETLFALNKEFLPVPKWRIFYSYGLKWLPEDYREFLKETMGTENFSVDDLDRRLKAIRKLWLKIVPKIEDETGSTPEQISKYYVHKILRQTWLPFHD